MSSHGSRVTPSGLTILLLAVSAAIGFCGYGLLLSLLGVLAGANLIAVGVKMADDPAALSRLVSSHGIASLTAYLRRNLAVAGLVAASSAVTAVVAGDPGPVLCFASFVLFLLGNSLVTLGAVGA